MLTNSHVYFDLNPTFFSHHKSKASANRIYGAVLGLYIHKVGYL